MNYLNHQNEKEKDQECNVTCGLYDKQLLRVFVQLFPLE